MKGGVSDHYSPKAILAGELVHFRYYLMPFSTYCQVHEEDVPCNSMAACMQRAISLGPSGNAQGGHKFLALNSGHNITCQTSTIIPMPSSVVEHINALGHNQQGSFIVTD